MPLTKPQLLDVLRASFRATRDARAQHFVADDVLSDTAVEDYARNAAQALIELLDEEVVTPPQGTPVTPATSLGSCEVCGCEISVFETRCNEHRFRVELDLRFDLGGEA